MNLPATLALAICLVPLAAPAQMTIYRCGGNEYTTIPCADGRPVDVLDPRSAAQRAESRRILAEEERRAKELQREREKQEKAIKPAAAAQIGAPQAATAASSPKKTTVAAKKRQPKVEPDPDRDFVAAVPGAKKAAQP